MLMILKDMLNMSLIDYSRAIFRHPSPILSGKYSSYMRALNICRTTYAEKELIKDTLQKSILYKEALKKTRLINISIGETDLLAIISLILNGKDKLNILDFGGGFGAKFLFVDKLKIGVKLVWDIIELDQLQQYKQDLKYEYGINSNELRYKKIDEAYNDYYDAAIFIASLQYVEAPEIVLKKVMDKKPKSILISNIFLSENEKKYYSIQKFNIYYNGPIRIKNKKYSSLSVPICILNKNELINLIANHYKLILIRRNDVYFIRGINKVYSYSIIGI